MKRILITGANSYIGTSFEKYIQQWPELYCCDTIDMIDGNWREVSFSDYDVVLHVAGIAHRKESDDNAALYYTVNRDLAVEVAQKAKCEGVKHFLLLSSMSVYGMTCGHITKETIETPITNYGKSKLEAENLIRPLESDNFTVSILRPPMVYGRDCKGNYQLLRNLARKTPIFPSVKNQRSMIYIDNLSSVIEHIIQEGKGGLFFPQNADYISTADMVRSIAAEAGRKVFAVGLFDPLIKLLAKRIGLFSKVFGSLTYAMDMNVDRDWLIHQTNEETISLTEKKSIKKVLLMATVTQMHINVFHIPVLKWFQDQGWETHVAASNDFLPPESRYVPHCDVYHELSFTRTPLSKGNLIAYRTLKKIIADEQFDVVHCHTPIAGMIARLAARKARKSGCKVFYTAHGFHFFRGAPLANWLMFYPVERLCSRYTDVLLTINEEDYVCAKKFHAKRLGHINGVGIDLSKFAKVLPVIEKTNIKHSLGIDDQAIVMVSVGELNANKNQQCAIQALAQIEDRRIHYLLCGRGPAEDGLKQLAKELGVADRVHFLGFRDDIPLILSIADIFVFPSKREGLPVSVIEAMAAGLPVVCSDVRGNRELIRSNENGFICICDDVAAFAEAIAALSADANLRAKIGARNREKSKNYNEHEVMQRLTEIYRETFEV